MKENQTWRLQQIIYHLSAETCGILPTTNESPADETVTAGNLLIEQFEYC